MYKDYVEMMDDMMADSAMDYEDDSYNDFPDDFFDGWLCEECGFNPYMGAYDYDC